MSPVFYLTERDVVTSLDQQSVLAALRQMLESLAQDQARNVPKSLATWGDGGSMHALGSLMPQRGYLGFKTWARSKTGGAAMFTLFDATSGNLLAIIEARALGQLRTSGISGVATDLLAPAGASRMALIGTGAQAMMQLASVAAVRTLKRVTIFSPTPEKLRAFVHHARHLFEFEIAEADSVGAATREAEIVTLITRARDPFLHAADLAPNVHLNAVGSITATHAEFHQDVFAAASAVVVDDLENARRGSRELREQFGTESSRWESVQTLAQYATGQAPVRAPGATVFKGMGMGLSDLAMAAVAYERVKALGQGRTLDHPERLDVLKTWRDKQKETDS